MADSVDFAFLHGGGQAGWVWAETVDALGQQLAGSNYRVKAFDLPGCGEKRHIDTSTLAVRDVVKAFAADLMQSGLQDIILVGHSNAGTIMPRIAELCPRLVRHYVFVSCIAPEPGQSIPALFSARGNKLDAESGGAKRLQEMFCNDMREADIPRFMAKLGHDSWPTRRALEEEDWSYDHLQDKSSTFVLCLKDQALPLPWQESFAARFHAKKRVYVDAGHQVMNTRPHTLAEILRNEI